MRVLSAFALYVSLAAVTLAADWSTLHSDGIEAVKRGDFTAAASLLRQALAVAATPAERGVSVNDLGVVLHQLHQEPEARRQLERAIMVWQSGPGNLGRLAETTEALAVVCRTLGDYPSAERALREVLKTPPAESENYALLFNELGDILRETGRAAEAYQFLEKTMALPGISVRRQLDATLGLADLDRDARHWQAAFDRWNKAIEITRQNHWPNLEAAALRGLGVTHLEHGEPARAEPLLRRALAGFEGSNAPLHQVASTLSCLAQLYMAENKPAMAEDVLQRGIDLSEKSLGTAHPQVAVLLEMLGDAVASRNQFAQARDYYGRARVIMAARFGEQSAIAAAVDASWAQVEYRSKHHNEAAADYEKALAVLDAAGPEAESLRATVRRNYAEVCKTLHRKSPPVTQSFRGTAASGIKSAAVGRMSQSN